MYWKAMVMGAAWLEFEINPENWEVIRAADMEAALRLLRVLRAASEIRGDIDWLKGKEVQTELEFDIGWGLGSSSTLISNVAWWAGIDPFLLSRSVSSGSGYDIACARSDKPLLYRMGDVSPAYHPVDFRPPFHEQLAFVYLGKKQDSASSVRNFLNKALVREADITTLSNITEKLSRTGQLDEFEELMREHEQLLSGILGLPTVKEGLFRDYPGAVKSLGAWGGDFAMITMHQEWQPVKSYFSARGMETVIPYREMVKTS
jgi:mevalonate kinase